MSQELTQIHQKNWQMTFADILTLLLCFLLYALASYPSQSIAGSANHTSSQPISVTAALGAQAGPTLAEDSKKFAENCEFKTKRVRLVGRLTKKIQTLQTAAKSAAGCQNKFTLAVTGKLDSRARVLLVGSRQAAQLIGSSELLLVPRASLGADVLRLTRVSS